MNQDKLTMDSHHNVMSVLHSNSNMLHSMKPYFHFGFGDTVLINSFVISGNVGLIVACIAFFILSMLYEGLKRYRELKFRLYYRNRSYQTSIIGTSKINTMTDSNDLSSPPYEQVISYKMLSWAHAIQSLLHMLQVFISLTLMLAFMTFNVWICASIVVGSGFGYFLFCWDKISIINPIEHCH